METLVRQHSALACSVCGKTASPQLARARNRKPQPHPFVCSPCEKRQREEEAARLVCHVCGCPASPAARRNIAKYRKQSYRCIRCGRQAGAEAIAAGLKAHQQAIRDAKAGLPPVEKAVKHVRTRYRLTDYCPPDMLAGTLCQCGPGVWAIRVESNQTEGQESVGALSSRAAAVAVAERRGICLMWEES